MEDEETGKFLIAGYHAASEGLEKAGSLTLLNSYPIDEILTPSNVDMQGEQGFEAQLVLVGDPNLFKEWNEPKEGVRISPIDKANKGDKFFISVLFKNCGTNEKGECDVTYDINMKDPNGGVHVGLTNAAGWKMLPGPQKDDVQLGSAYLVWVADESEPSGLYEVEAVVRDNIKNIELTLTESIDIQ